MTGKSMDKMGWEMKDSREKAYSETPRGWSAKRCHATQGVIRGYEVRMENDGLKGEQ